MPYGTDWGMTVFADTTPTDSPAPSASPSPAPSSEREILKMRKKAAEELDQYSDIKKIGTSESVQEKIKDVVREFKSHLGSRSQISKDDNGKVIGYTTEEAIATWLEDAKSAVDAQLDAKHGSSDDKDDDDDKPIGPSSSSDFILVGGNWTVPVVSYGQSVNIVLPVVNMGTENLHDVLVTPVVGNTAAEWPFTLDLENYTQTIPELPGKLNGQSDMDRRRELTWTLRARDDAMSGHYKLQFTLLYYVGAETESCTLTTYVKVNGAAGSGSIENESTGSSTPRVIVTGFSTEPAKVYAGDTFKLTLHLTNTSKRTDVSNMLVNISAPSDGIDADSSYAAFLPTSGSNSSYISKIAKGSTADLTIEMTAKKDLSQKPYQLDVNMEFEDDEFASYTSNADVSIPIHQDARFELNTPEVLPDSIAVGSESNIMFSIYNTGRLGLYNVKLHFEGDCVTGGEAYLGKIEAGGTGNVDVMVTGAAATEGENSVMAVITYEDESGEESRFEQAINLTVTGGDTLGDGMDMGGEFGEGYMMDDYQDVDYVDDVEDGHKPILWIVIGAAVALVVIIVIIVIGVKHSKKRKEEKEMSTLLSDLEEEGKDDSDEIS